MHLDLVRIHRCISDKYARVRNFLRLVNTRLLVEQEAFVQERIGESRAAFLYNLYRGQIAGALETQHRVYRELAEVLLVLRQDLGAQCRARDVHQILAETFGIAGVVRGRVFQSLSRHVRGVPPTGDNGLRVNLLVDQFLRFSQEFSGCKNVREKVERCFKLND